MPQQASHPATPREPLATKADLARAISALTRRFIGFGVLLAGAVTGVLGLLIRLWA